MSTQPELAVPYGLPPEFYALWLDKDLNYSCGLFLTGDESIEEAQTNKRSWFHDEMRLGPRSRVLDIGCGWGGNLRYLSREKGLRDLTGITLARAQADYLQAQDIPGVTIDCVSYRDYEPSKPFDAVVSIGMLEHVCTPAQIRSGEGIRIYRDYFARARTWTRPGASFGLQTVIGHRVPRDPKVLEELAWVTTEMFPGAISPRLEVVLAAMTPHWELIELRTRRNHYARTTRAWLARLLEGESTIRARWGDDVFLNHQRYLRACVRFFEEGYQSLAQFILQRID
jgi:cyclopropane-fatty-acyl-phospholipid synthase